MFEWPTFSAYVKSYAEHHCHGNNQTEHNNCCCCGSLSGNFDVTENNTRVGNDENGGEDDVLSLKKLVRSGRGQGDTIEHLLQVTSGSERQRPLLLSQGDTKNCF